MATTLHKTDQKKTYRKDYTGTDGRPECIIATVRYGDGCGNGHNSFAITANVYTRDRYHGEPTTMHSSGVKLWCGSGGCLHDAVAKHFPKLAPLIKWHLCSTDGPMHYIANTVYHAKEQAVHQGWVYRKWGGGKGFEQIKAEFYPPSGVSYNTSITYEPDPKTTKPRDLDAARSCAVWPEATDEELTSPGLKERLEERLPAMLAAFQADVESLGFVY
ncbi:MAG: hypothetical protein GY832_31695 [Chloroflexi bacterium]|nr:hypothetical protein [Chloroflexota bacterium]